MKLQTRTAQYYLIAAGITFITCGILSYFLLRREITRDVDERLYLRKSEIEAQIPGIATLGSIGSSLLVTIRGDAGPFIETLSDTMLYDTAECEKVPFRKLTYYSTINDTTYRITLLQSLIESEDLANSIILALAIVFGMFAAFSVGINILINRRVFKPFYQTLDLLTVYDVKTQKSIFPPKTAISEFQSLNTIIEKMTGKIHADFHNIKEFTENASHELQTPLAINISKLESLLDSKRLSQDQIRLIQDALQSSNRMARLNKGLLLLTRIESGRFSDVEYIDLRSEIGMQIEHYRELLDMKDIAVRTALGNKLTVKIHPSLATVLISTLFNNAIVHNIESGYIHISATPGCLTIENSGNPLPFSADQMFERFKKGTQTSSSMGLGLSIARKICDISGFLISYESVKSIHRISIRF
jgi:signal transduction histidine kinase